VDAGTSYLVIAIRMVLLGGGLGSTTAPATEAIMGRLSADKAGVRSAVNDTTRELAGTLGVAIVGSLFASVFTGRAADAAPLQSLAAEARAACTGCDRNAGLRRDSVGCRGRRRGFCCRLASRCDRSRTSRVPDLFGLRTDVRVVALLDVVSAASEDGDEGCGHLRAEAGSDSHGTGGRGRDRLGRRRRRKNMVPWRNTSRGLGRSKCPTALRQDRS
jgi:hypothetical protein